MQQEQAKQFQQPGEPQAQQPGRQCEQPDN